MKRKILITAVSLILILTVTAFIAVKKLKKETVFLPATKEYRDALKEAGFIKIPLLVKEEAEGYRSYYKKLYGVNFISNDEMAELLKENGFLIVASTFYIGEIPTASGQLMLKNLKTISAKEEHLDRYDNVEREFLNQKDAKDRWEAHTRMYNIGVVPLVFIAAPKEKFDLTNTRYEVDPYSRMLVAKKSDPIALYKIKEGWLELARW